MFKKIVSFLNQDVTNIKKEALGTETISQISVNLHNQALSEIKILSSIAKTLDNSSFQNPDFLFYIKIKSFFATNREQYQGLQQSAELLDLAVQAQANFLKIEQTELRYRSMKQQEYYNFVMNFLGEKFAEDDNVDNPEGANVIAKKKEKNHYSPEEFKQQIRVKLEEIKSTIKTDQGKAALEDYTRSLEALAAKKDIGLKLLYLFKKFNLTDFSILKTISDMVIYLQDKNMQNMKAMQDLVMKNQDVFLKVGKIIGIPKTKETPESYGRILQYLALSKKHENSIKQFTKLMDVLKQWQNFYKTISDIREQYPATQYQQPDEFKQEIPGLSIYQNYGEYLPIFK
ncbi:hypothetical protein [Geminocystis sp. NIES-3709]|uniref:hypothetical protein n=1 Tax=Geminocystis sp. NIES-3709 TaxID=1617448 RepID=UPI0005FC7744|nr:hypothetical protein [Geminocystis sp. NIES-3709]BAQ65425.1 hypothetical protein GM3709_2190 [Geminocystis sp. NIES-3709]